MKSISSLSVMILIIMNNIIVNGTECLPNGCFYDLSVDLTKKIQCKSDGSLEILHYHGDNGCENEEYYLSHLTYNSPVENSCCEPARIHPTSAPTSGCTDSWQCPQNEYCNLYDECVPNPCYNNEGTHGCLNNNAECPHNGNILCHCGEIGGSAGWEGGLCLPLIPGQEEEPEPELTQYTVKVINKGSSSAKIGIFETNPSDTLMNGGYPIVFAAQSVPDSASGTGSGTFTWTLDWGLSWSDGPTDTCQQLEEDIIYHRRGDIIGVSPTDPNNNGAAISYDKANEVYDIVAKANDDLQQGQLQLITDDSFTKSQASADCFTVSVTQQGNPVFAVPGQPNYDYQFQIKPTYYMSTMYYKNGETVSVAAVSESYKIQFGTATEITLCIDDSNKFSPCTA